MATRESGLSIAEQYWLLAQEVEGLRANLPEVRDLQPIGGPERRVQRLAQLQAQAEELLVTLGERFAVCAWHAEALEPSALGNGSARK